MSARILVLGVQLEELRKVSYLFLGRNLCLQARTIKSCLLLWSIYFVVLFSVWSVLRCLKLNCVIWYIVNQWSISMTALTIFLFYWTTDVNWFMLLVNLAFSEMSSCAPDSSCVLCSYQRTFCWDCQPILCCHAIYFLFTLCLTSYSVPHVKPWLDFVLPSMDALILFASLCRSNCCLYCCRLQNIVVHLLSMCQCTLCKEEICHVVAYVFFLNLMFGA